MLRQGVMLGVLAFANAAAADSQPFEPAAAFGARQSIVDLSLSPDGKSVAYVAALAGKGAAVFTLDLAESSKPRVALTAAGKPDRLGGCNWVSNSRLACVIYGVVRGGLELLPFNRLIAVDRTGGNLQLLSTRQNEYSRGVQLGGGDVIDWLPDEEGAVLMTRNYLPDEHLGTRAGSWRAGTGVDRIDTVSLRSVAVEVPALDAVEYLSDGRGAVRVVGRTERNATHQSTGIYNYSYRRRGSRDWYKLSDYNEVDRSGFHPEAVDHDLDVVYGFKKLDGRRALYSLSLDGTLTEKLVFSRPDVDVDGLVRIGRRGRVVGVTYATDERRAVYFDPEIEKLMSAFSRALPQQPRVRVVDSSVDEQVLLVFAGSDDDPGVYYIFDRQKKQLHTFLVVRNQLEGVKLAKVRAVTYPASDGVLIPGYLTLPPGREDAKGLPAIVLPHGGPSARDFWGFDWLSQFYAARGFAVLQPNFRGSAGYGDAWLQQNGFRSWRIAVGDVDDAGHWLVAQGIADPAKLCIVGWSYGGYAALQSAVLEPGLFKAVVAIAPVTDLSALKEEHRGWSDFNLVSDFVGAGPHIREGSPARNADKIKVPVMLVHAALDRNVAFAQSRAMADRLASAGVKHEFLSWDDLDHYLDDSDARTEMLRKSDAFLRQATGMAP